MPDGPYLVPGGRHRLWYLLGGILLLTGGLAACSPATAAGTPVATSTVTLPPSYRFAPTDIAVPPGTTVTWINDDHFTHSVQFLDGGLDGEPLLIQPGETATIILANRGLFHYQCHLHPQNMQGSVTVAP